MKVDIMSNIGKLVFVLLCVKYRNDLDEYLAIMKINQMNKYFSGLTPIEYSDWIRTKEQEQGFLNNFEDNLPSQYLIELLASQKNTKVGIE